MTISVIAGNEAAMRLYRREGASDHLHKLIMPVRKASLPPAREPPNWRIGVGVAVVSRSVQRV